MTSRVAVSAAAAALVLLAVSGCGGSSSRNDRSSSAGRSSAHASSSATAFHQQGNRLCAAALHKLKAIPRPQTESQVASYLRKSLRIGNREVSDLAALHPPSSARAAFAVALAGARRESAALTRLARRLEAGRSLRHAFPQVNRVVDRIDAKVNANFRRVGLPECAK